MIVVLGKREYHTLRFEVIDLIKASDRMINVHSDIRGPLYFKALEMQQQGINVLKLNTGNPGAFGFGMPESVKQALVQGMDDAVAYCDSRGMARARSAILAYHKKKGLDGIGLNDIFLSNGVSEAVEILTQAILNPGDEVLCPSPNYSLWSNCIYLAGARPVFYRCDEQASWNPDCADIRSRITSRTRAIVIINPNNPTGALYSEQVLKEMLEMARRNHLIVFSDEIYDRLVYEPKQHVSCACLAPDLNVITLNGLSKSHMICGFRCGWFVLNNPNGELDEIRGAIERLCSMRLCANALTQLVIPAALEDSASTRAQFVPGGRLYEQRKAVTDALTGVEGISFVKNDAAFYLFPRFDAKRFHVSDDRELAMGMLLEKQILIVPGSGFDYPRPDHFRIVMLPDAATLSRAAHDMVDYLNSRI